MTCNTECVNSLNNTNWTFVTGLVLTTDAASAVTSTGGTLNGNITATGNEDASEHGFAYGTSATMATTISTTTLGAYSGTGSFKESISSLTCNTTYYFRPYASNSSGTGYSDSIISFTTSACSVTPTTTGNRSGRRLPEAVTDVFTYLLPTNIQKSGTATSTILEKLPIEIRDAIVIGEHDETVEIITVKKTDGKIDDVRDIEIVKTIEESETPKSLVSKIFSLISDTFNGVLKILKIR